MPSLGALLRRVTSPTSSEFPRRSLRPSTPPVFPRRRTESTQSVGSSSFRSSVASSSAPSTQYSHDTFEHDTSEHGLVPTTEEGRKCKCRDNCLSFSLPPEKIIDFGSPEAPAYTTPLRPPPRASLRLSDFRGSPPLILFPASPPPSLPGHDFSDDDPEPIEEPEDDDSDSDYESATEDDLEPRRRSRPPTLLVRATLPRNAPTILCTCSDPLCPGGELDQAYDAPLPCDCGLPECLGGDMSLAWKMRADGIRKSDLVRHVKNRNVHYTGRNGIVWGYSPAHV